MVELPPHAIRAIFGVTFNTLRDGWLMEPERSAVVLGERLGHVFVDLLLLERALTHRSWANEHAPAVDNESLAFLGDAVLALVVAEHLWRAAPGRPSAC